jgi:hypothetical protein
MKITKTFYYNWGTANGFDAENYDTNTTPFEIVSPVASLYMNIPFKVSKIHVKNITYVSGRAGNQGNPNVANYVTLMSTLAGQLQPFGSVHRDSQFSMATISDVEHTFDLPIVINGQYDFVFYRNSGTAMAFSTTDNPSYYPFYFEEEILEPLFPNIYTYWFDSFSITLEFNSPEEIF